MSRQDKGWAWVIVSAVMLQNFLVVGLLKSFGLLFVELLETFNGSASMTSAILGLQAASFCVAAPICLHYFSTKFSYRTLMFVGAVTSSTGIAMSFSATGMVYLLFSCGVMIGVGNALMHGPSLVMIGHYFKRRLSIANSIAIGGGSLGQFAFPPLVYILFEYYSLRGSLLVIGGLMFNCCISAALMKPFRHVNQNEQKENMEDFFSEDLKVQEAEKGEHVGFLVEENNKGTGKTGGEVKSSSEISEGSGTDNHHRNCTSSCSLPALIDLSLCRNPLFILLEIASALGNAGSTLHTIYLVPHARDLGIDEKMTSLMVTIIGVADLCGKLLCGCFADSGWVKRYKLLAGSLLVSGVFANFLVFFTSLESMLGYCVVVGLIGGFYYSLLSPVLVDFLGTENLPCSLGITLCCEGVANTITPVVLGYLKDTTHSYIASFHLIGMFLIVAALSLLSTKIVKKTCARYIDQSVDMEQDKGS